MKRADGDKTPLGSAASANALSLTPTTFHEVRYPLKLG